MRTRITRYEPLEPEELHDQLLRMASEFVMFPFRPSRGRRSWRRAEDLPLNGQYIVQPMAFGAFVYYDILAEGGRGTRGEVRRVIDRLLLSEPVPPDDRPTMKAATTVALLRVRDPEKVSEPMLPEASDYEYKAQPVDVREEHQRMLAATKYGRRAVQRIKSVAEAALTPRAMTAIAQSAEKAWAQARLADVSDADWLAHLDEVIAVRQLTRALRTSVVEVVKKQQAAGTRLITLHEDN
jgi:hypothetical protein